MGDVVVVLGGGIVGLSTALRLLEAGMSVTVVAASYDDTCSHCATSWFIPDPTYGRGHGSEAAGFTGPLYKRWAHRTFEVMAADVDVDAPAGGGFTKLCEGVRLYTAKGAPEGMGPIVSGPTSVGQFVPEFRELKSGDGAWNAVDAVAGARDEGAALVGGTAFRTLCTDMHAYLAHLRQRLTAGGATLETIRIDSIADLSDRYPDAACLINCAGYGNRELVGDETMIPVRGQTVLVRAPEQRSFFSLVTGDKRHPVHVIPQGNGTCIVGGAKYAGDTREEPEAELAERLLRQAVAWCPALRDARENVLSHRVAFRPFRKDGVRLEVDPASGQLPGVLSPVVHNYGHGDVGVILAWGCAEDARELVRGAIADHVARKRQRRS